MDEQDTIPTQAPDDTSSRRTFLKGAAATGLAVAAATSLPVRKVQAASTQNLAFWNLFGGGDGVRMIQMEKDFAKANPSIQVKATTLAWGIPYYTKLTTSTVAGKAPDIGILHMTRLPAYAPSGLLTPLDPGVLAKHGITPDKFLPGIWSKGQYQGKTYAIPLDTHPMVMYYNVDICKKAGLLDASGKLKPMVGPAAVLNAFKAAQKVTGKYGVSMDTVDVMNWRVFSGLYAQLGGTVVSPDAKSVTLDTAKATKVLQFMAELTSSKVAPANADYPSSVALFSSGKAGFLWNGEWEVPTFQGLKMNFDITLFPNVFGSYATQADSHSFVVPHQRNMSSDRLDAILTFISFMLKDSVVWAEGGHIPAYLPATTGAAYKNLVPQSHYASAAKYVTYDPNAWWSGAASQMENDAGSYFQGVYLGKSTPAQAVSQFRADLQKLINTPQPS